MCITDDNLQDRSLKRKEGGDGGGGVKQGTSHSHLNFPFQELMGSCPFPFLSNICHAGWVN